MSASSTDTVRNILLSIAAVAALAAVACRSAIPVVAPATETAVATPTAVAPTLQAFKSAEATVEVTGTPQQSNPRAGLGRIVYTHQDGGIYTVAPDGSDSRRVVSPSGQASDSGFKGAYMWPAWSPDGETIMYSAVLSVGKGQLDISLRRALVSTGDEFTMFQDDPATSGIGSGVPHYAAWSPDGKRVAIIAGTGKGLVGELVNAETGDREATLADGAPMYFSWSPDSRRILVHHQEFLKVYEFDGNGEPVGGPRRIGRGSLDYYAPSFSPDGDHLLYAETSDRTTRVFTTSLDDPQPTLVLESRGRTAFRWSPDGRRIAVLDQTTDGLFDHLGVFTAAGRQLFDMTREAMFSFWWSPDSTKLAIASVSPPGQRVIDWTVLDVRDQSEKQVASIGPFAEFLFMQLYFDQYAHSIQIWSPDSRFLVLFGSLAGTGDPAAYRLASQHEAANAWVVDVTGAAEAVLVGHGYIGAWSPR